jgi:hypothetical protein
VPTTERLILASLSPIGGGPGPGTVQIGFPQLDPGADELVAGGRLSLSSTEPVPTTDQSAKTILYYLPYVHDKIGLWNGSSYKNYTIPTGMSLTPTLAASKVYDVFCYLSGTTPTLELGPAWTNNTTRATDVVYHGDYGRKVKSGDVTRLWLGTIATDSSSKMNDTAQDRALWNAFNSVQRGLGLKTSTVSHSYVGAARAYNNDTSNKFEFVCGSETDTLVHVSFQGYMDATGASYPALGPNIDTSTSIPHTDIEFGLDGTAYGYISCLCQYSYGGNSGLQPTVVLGRHPIYACQAGSGTNTFYGYVMRGWLKA